jgi:hypothetical protein
LVLVLRGPSLSSQFGICWGAAKRIAAYVAISPRCFRWDEYFPPLPRLLTSNEFVACGLVLVTAAENIFMNIEFLIGKWLLVLVSINGKVEFDYNKAEYLSLLKSPTSNEYVQVRKNERLLNNYVEFLQKGIVRANGDFLTKVVPGYHYSCNEGNWKFNPTTKQLVIKCGTQQISSFEVLELSRQSLTLRACNIECFYKRQE